MSTEVPFEPETELQSVPPPAPERKNGKKASAEHVARPAQIAERELDAIDARELKSYITSLAGNSPLRVSISRQKPIVSKGGDNIGGILEHVDEAIEEEYIKEMWGGGTFLLKISTPQGNNGAMKYTRGVTVKIAGPPKMGGVVYAGEGGGGSGGGAPISLGADPVVAAALDMNERAARRAEDRADRVEQMLGHSQGFDAETFKMFTDPLHETIRELRQQIADVTNRPVPRDELRDELIKTAVQGEGRQIAMLREQYEGRIDKLRDNHDDQVKRIEDRHAADIKRIEDRFERMVESHRDELKRISENHQAEIRRIEDRHSRDLTQYDKTHDRLDANSKVSFEMQVAAKNSEIAKLERDLNAATAKIGTLETIKQQTMGDKIEEIVKLKEGLEGIGGGDGDDASWWEKAIGAVGNIPAVTNVLEKLAGGNPAQQQPQQQFQQQPPPGQPFQGPDGNVYVFDQAGQMHQLNPAQLAQLQAQQQQRAIAAGGGQAPKRRKPPAPGAPAAASGAPQGRAPTASETEIAVNFIEGAIKNGTDADSFAATARAVMDGQVLMYMRSVGFEKFMAGANLKPGSQLLTQKGKNFLRAVHKALFEGGAAAEQPTEISDPIEQAMSDGGDE